MKTCTDPKLGHLLSLYEFDKLSQDDRDLFEQHLLECDACFQDLYEFSPAIEMIKEHRDEFQAAISSPSLIHQWLSKVTSIIAKWSKSFWSSMDAIPSVLRPAIPVLAAAMLVFAVVKIIQFDKVPDNLTNVGDSEKVVLHEPEIIESKGSTDSILPSDSSIGQSPTAGSARLKESMEVALTKDGKSYYFSWLNLDSIKVIHLYLIHGTQKTQITPGGGIHESHFEYPMINIDKSTDYLWELKGEMMNGKGFSIIKTLYESNDQQQR